MMQPIRPQDASSIYRQQAASTTRAGGSTPAAGTEGNDAAGGARSGRRIDRVTLSPEGLQLQRVLDAMSQLPDVREARIAALQQQIADGTYDRGITEVAQRLIEGGGLK